MPHSSPPSTGKVVGGLFPRFSRNSKSGYQNGLVMTAGFPKYRPYLLFLSSPLLTLLRLFFSFNKFISCGGAAGFKNDYISLGFGGFHLCHCYIADVDDTT